MASCARLVTAPKGRLTIGLQLNKLPHIKQNLLRMFDMQKVGGIGIPSCPTITLLAQVLEFFCVLPVGIAKAG